ncbi:hypothetical protein [Idiomarina sp.]|uniref:hypothetical protein n=1 Tax=Idiomarina sp. TaxID=1874361 RepID=UPI0025C66300|nr:hypothetical protein [Idiomarina sp.]NQZ05501.1 hypothetical protein [Idiomarina sp.]
MVKEVAELVSILGVLTTLVALWFTVRSFNRQLQLTFFSEYTKRYQEITLNLPSNINEQSFSFDALPPELKDRTLRYMRAYFDLCSEEYFLKRKNHLDDETWKEWKTGMEFSFSKTAFREAWKLLQLNSTYYGEFTAFVTNCMPR